MSLANEDNNRKNTGQGAQNVFERTDNQEKFMSGLSGEFQTSP